MKEILYDVVVTDRCSGKIKLPDAIRAFAAIYGRREFDENGEILLREDIGWCESVKIRKRIEAVGLICNIRPAKGHKKPIPPSRAMISVDDYTYFFGICESAVIDGIQNRKYQGACIDGWWFVIPSDSRALDAHPQSASSGGKAGRGRPTRPVELPGFSQEAHAPIASETARGGNFGLRHGIGAIAKPAKLALVAGLLHFLFVANGPQNIPANLRIMTAKDLMKEFELAESQGDKFQTCVQAIQISSSLLQANDLENHRKWKEVEKAKCRF